VARVRTIRPASTVRTDLSRKPVERRLSTASSHHDVDKTNALLSSHE
jgi:hypothetical protein